LEHNLPIPRKQGNESICETIHDNNAPFLKGTHRLAVAQASWKSLERAIIAAKAKYTTWEFEVRFTVMMIVSVSSLRILGAIRG